MNLHIVSRSAISHETTSTAACVVLHATGVFRHCEKRNTVPSHIVALYHHQQRVLILLYEEPLRNTSRPPGLAEQKKSDAHKFTPPALPAKRRKRVDSSKTHEAPGPKSWCDILATDPEGNRLAHRATPPLPAKS